MENKPLEQQYVETVIECRRITINRCRWYTIGGYLSAFAFGFLAPRAVADVTWVTIFCAVVLLALIALFFWRGSYWRKQRRELERDLLAEIESPRGSEEEYRTTIRWMRAAYLNEGELA